MCTVLAERALVSWWWQADHILLLPLSDVFAGIPEDLLLGQLQVLTLLQAQELVGILKQRGLLTARIITATSQAHVPRLLWAARRNTKVWATHIMNECTH